MNALVVTQPWAWGMARGIVDVVNFFEPVDFRGRFLIIARGGRLDEVYYEGSVRRLEDFAGRVLGIPALDLIGRGGVVGWADVVDCVSESESRFFGGKWGCVLAHARVLPFVRCRVHGPRDGKFFAVLDEVWYEVQDLLAQGVMP